MWVCHCHAVTDARIRALVSDGASDMHDVAARCGAGTGCGGCRDEVRRLCDQGGHKSETNRPGMAIAS